eukprot:scaffold47081_cov64-Phaeocystis_antarctica.AAC.2
MRAMREGAHRAPVMRRYVAVTRPQKLLLRDAARAVEVKERPHRTHELAHLPHLTQVGRQAVRLDERPHLAQAGHVHGHVHVHCMHMHGTKTWHQDVPCMWRGAVRTSSSCLSEPVLSSSKYSNQRRRSCEISGTGTRATRCRSRFVRTKSRSPTSGRKNSAREMAPAGHTVRHGAGGAKCVQGSRGRPSRLLRHVPGYSSARPMPAAACEWPVLARQCRWYADDGVRPGRGTILVVVPPGPELLQRLLEALHVERELRHQSLHHLAQGASSGSGLGWGWGRGRGRTQARARARAQAQAQARAAHLVLLELATTQRDAAEPALGILREQRQPLQRGVLGTAHRAVLRGQLARAVLVEEVGADAVGAALEHRARLLAQVVEADGALRVLLRAAAWGVRRATKEPTVPTPGGRGTDKPWRSQGATLSALVRLHHQSRRHSHRRRGRGRRRAAAAVAAAQIGAWVGAWVDARIEWRGPHRRRLGGGWGCAALRLLAEDGAPPAEDGIPLGLRSLALLPLACRGAAVRGCGDAAVQVAGCSGARCREVQRCRAVRGCGDTEACRGGAVQQGGGAARHFPRRRRATTRRARAPARRPLAASPAGCATPRLHAACMGQGRWHRRLWKRRAQAPRGSGYQH